MAGIVKVVIEPIELFHDNDTHPGEAPFIICRCLLEDYGEIAATKWSPWYTLPIDSTVEYRDGSELVAIEDSSEDQIVFCLEQLNSLILLCAICKARRMKPTVDASHL